MNHIKTFKLFESDSYDEIKINCEDILIDISDNGFEVTTSYLKKNNEESKDYFQFTIGSSERSYSEGSVKLGEFKDNIKRLISYLNGEGFELSPESYCINYTWEYSECCPSCRSQSIVIPDEKNDSILMCNNCNYTGDKDDFLTASHPVKDDIIWLLDNNYYVHLLSLIFTR